MNQEILTTHQSALYCGVTIQTIKNWLAINQVEGYKTPGGHWRIHKTSLDVIRDGGPEAVEVTNQDILDRLEFVNTGILGLTADMAILINKLAL